MNTILNEENEDFQEKISLDELYDEKQTASMFQLEIFKKVLAKVHKKIKMSARLKQNNTFCFFLIPEFLFGCPKYNMQECTTYIIEKLIDNGFHIKYTHPNLLFISWQHYIPSYQREEIKKQTGITVDGFGNVVKSKPNPMMNTSKSNNLQMLLNTAKTVSIESQPEPEKKKSDYKDIKTYKPSGIYDSTIMNLDS